MLLVGSAPATSIPAELAVVLTLETETVVSVAAFYDDTPADIPGLDAVDFLHTNQNFLRSVVRVVGALPDRPSSTWNTARMTR